MTRSRYNRGFTAAEMMVASAIGAMVLGAATIAFSALSRAQRAYTSTATVRIGATAMTAFYGSSSNNIDTCVAPSYGNVARAESLREKFMEDLVQATAVYCLPRATGNYNTVRPTVIPAPPYGTAMDTPEGFRAYINTVGIGSSFIFTTSIRNTISVPCYSIFLLSYSNSVTSIPVIAVYDIDLIPAYDPITTTTQVGTYASVKRYKAGALSAYYDVFYPTGDATDSFTPPVVCFERRTRLALVEGSTTIDRFKVAAEMPFYFVFWPDPARDSLKLPLPNTVSSLNASFAATDPRKDYNHMAGRTSYMFTIPMFPSR